MNHNHDTDEEEFKKCWLNILNDPTTTVWDIFKSLPEYEKIMEDSMMQIEYNACLRDIVRNNKKICGEDVHRDVINHHTNPSYLPYHLFNMAKHPIKGCHEILECFTNNSLSAGQHIFLPITYINMLSYCLINNKTDLLTIGQSATNLVHDKCKCFLPNHT